MSLDEKGDISEGRHQTEEQNVPENQATIADETNVEDISVLANAIQNDFIHSYEVNQKDVSNSDQNQNVLDTNINKTTDNTKIDRNSVENSTSFLDYSISKEINKEGDTVNDFKKESTHLPYRRSEDLFEQANALSFDYHKNIKRQGALEEQQSQSNITNSTNNTQQQAPQKQQQSQQLQQQQEEQQQQQSLPQQLLLSEQSSKLERTPEIDLNEIYQYIADLTVSSKRDKALLELSRRREHVPDLAPLLWHSFGVITAILQEIISIYAYLTPPNLTSANSNRVCNALALLQTVASHSETRQLFLNAHIPLLFYPFLNTISTSRPFEYLRLTSLGVIGALVKIDDPEVIGFLLQTENISLCLRIMEMGSELSKTVATFIVQKILLNDLGLRYVCATAERFYALSSVLGGMVINLVNAPSFRLLKHIIKCYLRLADSPRAKEALKKCIPTALHDPSLLACIKNDPTITQNYITLATLIDKKIPPSFFKTNCTDSADSTSTHNRIIQVQQSQPQQTQMQQLQTEQLQLQAQPQQQAQQQPQPQQLQHLQQLQMQHFQQLRQQLQQSSTLNQQVNSNI